jgi:hypothetical protein
MSLRSLWMWAINRERLVCTVRTVVTMAAAVELEKQALLEDGVGGEKPIEIKRMMSNNTLAVGLPSVLK